MGGQRRTSSTGTLPPEETTQVNVADDVLTRAEAVNGTPSITLHQAELIQQAFERAGIRFGRNGAVLMAAVEARS